MTPDLHNNHDPPGGFAYPDIKSVSEPEPVSDVVIEEPAVDVPRRRIDLVAHDIQGIIYYVDHDQQVYHIEDLLDERPNPRIVGYLQRSNSRTSRLHDSYTFVPSTVTV